MKILKFCYKYFRKSMPIAILAEILSFIGLYTDLLIPILSSMLIDFVIKKGTVTPESGGMFSFLLTGKYGEVHSMKLFFSIGVVYTIMALVRIVFIYIRDLMQESVGLKLESDLRYETFNKLMELDSQTISDYNSGELLQILNRDTIMFKELFSHRIPYLGDAIFMLVTSIILLSSIHIYFIFIPLLLMPILVLAVLDFKKKARINFEQIRKKSSAINLNTQENIAAVRIVRSFTNEELEKDKFHKSNTEFLNERLKQIWLVSKFDLTFNSIKQIAFISTIIIGALLTIQGKMTVGYIMASSTYVMRIMNNITSLNNHILNMQQEIVAGSALNDFMLKESKINDSNDKNLRSDTPSIELKNVCLNIDGQDILKNINISIPYGKKIGIVGETGSGKSVLVKTLVRIRDVTDGTIEIDGHNIKEFSLENLRSMYSYVFQDVFLFSNSIESNIAYSNFKFDQKLVKEAAVNAQADKFIDALADRYKTVVGERGLGISGGQKQRVSIARAFHKNSPIFVMDDSTSALDVNTERNVLKNIYENFPEKTLIITAHRFSSVVECDEIFYMREGEIVERGTFKELIELNGRFASIYNIQKEQHTTEHKANSIYRGEING